MKSIKGLMAAYMLMGMGGFSSRPLNKDPRDIDTTPKTPPMPPGMKEWNINGKTVYAVTKKAAMKKAGVK